MGVFSSSDGHACPAPKNAAEMTTVDVPIVGSETFQNLILYICSACLGIVGIICLLNIFMHLSHYSSPKQQRQIIRVVFTPVVFCLFSVCAVAKYSTAIYVAPLRDLYETFAMASIFLLFVEWVAPNPSTRDAYFSTLENRKPTGGRFIGLNTFDIIPGGSVAWFKSKWMTMFLSLVIDIIIAIAQEGSQAAGTYCDTSLKPYFAHLWVLLIGHAAIIAGILAVLRLYLRLKTIPEFAKHRPLLKLASLKLIVFTNFIQTFIFSILQGQGVLIGNQTITASDLQYGIPALLVSIEQLLFASLMLYSFRATEYKHSGPPQMGFLPSVFHTLNPLDLLQSMFQAFTYLLTGRASDHNSTSTSTSTNTSAFLKFSPGTSTLQPVQEDTGGQQTQCSAPPQLAPTCAAPQEHYISSPPYHYGQQDEFYPFGNAMDNTTCHQPKRHRGRDGGSGRRRYRGLIGMLIGAGTSAVQSAQDKR